MNDLPQDWKMLNNILNSYDKATEDEVQEGMVWYPKAYDECARIADATNDWYDVRQIIGIMAVGSPGVDWRENFTIPEKMVDLHMRGVPVEEWVGFTCYRANLLKCQRVLDGEYEAIKGRKTVSFFCNINGDPDMVTVDRWAVRVAMGSPYIENDKLAPSGARVYNKLADIYALAAEMVGIENRQLQAVTWTQYRNEYMGKIGAKRRRITKEMEIVNA